MRLHTNLEFVAEQDPSNKYMNSLLAYKSRVVDKIQNNC